MKFGWITVVVLVSTMLILRTDALVCLKLGEVCMLTKDEYVRRGVCCENHQCMWDLWNNQGICAGGVYRSPQSG